MGSFPVLLITPHKAFPGDPKDLPVLLGQTLALKPSSLTTPSPRQPNMDLLLIRPPPPPPPATDNALEALSRDP